MQNMRTIFLNIDDQEELAHFHAKDIEIIGVLADPDELSVINWIAMPSYHIKFIETGEISTAYLDEVASDFVMPEMESVLAGMEAHLKGNNYVPLCFLYPQHYANGIKLSEVKNSDPISSSINLLIDGWCCNSSELEQHNR